MIVDGENGIFDMNLKLNEYFVLKIFGKNIYVGFLNEKNWILRSKMIFCVDINRKKIHFNSKVRYFCKKHINYEL